MNTKRWESVKELLHQALQLRPEQRGVFLDEACASDISLRAEVDSLLAAEEDVRTSFMESPVPAGELIGAIGSAKTLEAGQVFSQKFQLIRKLGEGGMGQVWLADQTSPVRRQVALKLIKAGMYDESVVQRFQSERQSLAIMDHPAIAKVFDAGTTEQGQPYFVMEYVPGLPITEYCDEKKLSIRQRLDLFIQACEGVQHAHQKAILHRDIKPANILVLEVDGKPVPRIIDFGLAKAITPQPNGETLYTLAGGLVGTPGYMSPEQAEPGGPDVDTRSDVYSLGVVLYVLLTGVLPIDTKVGQQPLVEILRKLREEEPLRPSTKITADRQSSVTTAQARATHPAELKSLLRGDLDWIAMKALEKDRARRYGTPSELAADLQRYLNHEPVIARPATVSYRLQKYARRHRVGVSVAALLVLLFIGFAILQTVQLRRITRERDRANRERDRATRVTDFMTNMFLVADPNEAKGNTITAREILDKASKDMQAALAQDPEVQSQLMQTMSRVYINLGLNARAHKLAQSSLDARMKLLGPDDPKTLESMTLLGWILISEGHAAEAEKVEREAMERERRVLGPEAPLTLESMDRLAVAVQDEGRYEEEEKLERQVIEIATRTLGPESDRVLRSMNNLGTALWNEGHYADAEQQYRHLLEVDQRVWGPEHPQTLITMGNLALTIQSQGRYEEPEQLYRQLLTIEQRVLGPEHPVTMTVMENLADNLVDQGHLVEGEKLHRQALDIRMRTLGAEHASTMITKLNLASVLLLEGHTQEAEKLQRDTLTTQSRVLGPENPDTWLSQTDLARTFIHEHRYAEAEKLARESFDRQHAKLGPEHSDTLDSLQVLATAIALNHHYDEANKLFQDTMKEADSSNGPKDPATAWYMFARMAAYSGHTDDALHYLHEAVKGGFNSANELVNDDDLKSLRANPGFQQIVAQLRQQPAAVASH